MSVIKFMRALLSRPSHLPRPHLFIPSHLELDSSLLYNWPSLETIMEKEMATHSLENPRDRGAWWAAIYGVAQSRTQLKRLSSSSRNHHGEGNATTLQYSCLKDPRDRGTWWTAIYGVAQSWTWLKQHSSSRSGRNHQNSKALLLYSY